MARVIQVPRSDSSNSSNSTFDESTAFDGVETPEMIERIEACLAIIKQEPAVAKELPYRNWDEDFPNWTWTDPLDVNDPLMSEEQVLLLHGWQQCGYMGIASVIKAFVEQILEEEQDSAPKAYKDFITNCTHNPHYLFDALATIPSKFVEPIILGTLPAYLETRKHLEKSVAPRGTPGGYLNYAVYQPAHDGSSQASQPGAVNPDIGKWMSGEMLMKVVEDLRLYISKDQATEAKRRELAKDLDNQFAGNDRKDMHYNDNAFRFAKNDDQKAAIKNWCDTMSDVYIDNGLSAMKTADNPLFKEPMARCAVECGWAHDVQNRITSHATMRQTTAIYGAVTSAWKRQAYLEGGETTVAIRQYHIIKAPSEETARATEIALTFLSGARVENGGYNYSAPGGMALQPDKEKFYRLNLLDRFGGVGAKLDREASHKKVLAYAAACEKVRTEEADAKAALNKLDKYRIAAIEMINETKKRERARKEKKEEERNDVLLAQLVQQNPKV